jgi:hypothetical protein
MAKTLLAIVPVADLVKVGAMARFQTVKALASQV